MRGLDCVRGLGFGLGPERGTRLTVGVLRWVVVVVGVRCVGVALRELEVIIGLDDIGETASEREREREREERLDMDDDRRKEGRKGSDSEFAHHSRDPQVL